MRTRTSAQELGQDAVAALRDAASAVGLVTARSRDDEAADLVLQLGGHDRILVQVKAASIPSRDRARALVESRQSDALSVLVADQVPSNIRTMLNEAGVGWLDRRGHLHLVGTGLHVDSDVPALSRRVSGRGSLEPIKGRSGLAAAAGLLLRPDDPRGVSEIARVAGLNPSSITRAMRSLADAQLAERGARGRYRALVPELFWSLADVWPREHVTIHWAEPPEQDERLDLGDSNLSGSGWAAAGVRGAVAWGAPIVATADFPIRLFAPSEQLVREMKVLHAGGTGGEAILSADPVGFITSERYHAGQLEWPVAHPLFCALDLTVSSRDREALEQWTPPDGFTRVW